MSTARTNRHDVVTRLLKEYFDATGKTFKYPKSNAQLEQLRSLIAETTPATTPPKPSRWYNLILERSALSDQDRIYRWIPDDTVKNALVHLISQIVAANPSIKLMVVFKVKFISAIDPMKS